MTIHTTRIAIVGGGLAGLSAARQLEQYGIQDYVLLEARSTWGGRIASVVPAPDSAPLDSFDLGPAWFWPAYQRQLDGLIETLGLERFAQHEAGAMVVEQGANAVPVRTQGYESSPPSMRLAGGMGALIDAVLSQLNPKNLVLGQSVQRLRCDGLGVGLDAEDAQGQAIAYRAEHVLLAVPPRLALAAIEFLPALPEAVARAWRSTATWMASQAKYVAIYDEAFWRAQGLSGEARSARGPLGEIHDASKPRGSAALFGFFGVPARVRHSVSDEVLRTHCRAQLGRLFGAQAANPKADFIKDWSADPFTATEADREGPGQHVLAPAASVATGLWQGRLTGVASEWSAQFPGYVAGAVGAATDGVATLLERRS